MYEAVLAASAQLLVMLYDDPDTNLVPPLIAYEAVCANEDVPVI